MTDRRTPGSSWSEAIKAAVEFGLKTPNYARKTPLGRKSAGRNWFSRLIAPPEHVLPQTWVVKTREDGSFWFWRITDIAYGKFLEGGWDLDFSGLWTTLESRRSRVGGIVLSLEMAIRSVYAQQSVAKIL